MEISNDDYDEEKKLDVSEELGKLARVIPERDCFPCCLVWTPLPIVSWLAPFVGHIGICREDGVILDFAGSYFVSVGDFAFGKPARYLQLDLQKCCFPPNLSAHRCKHGYKHAEFGTAMSWDDALQSSMNNFQHRTYNLFTCNCHSFVANCLNRLSYMGSLDWNMVNVCILILFKGKWVNTVAVVRSFSSFSIALFIGYMVAGWQFLIGLGIFSLLLIGWFVLGSYFCKSIVDC